LRFCLSQCLSQLYQRTAFHSWITVACATEYVRLHFRYDLPRASAAEGSRKTVVAVNVGGALIPSIVSLYLLWQFPDIAGVAIVGVTLVAIVPHLTSRPVAGVGIVSRTSIPARCCHLYHFRCDTGSSNRKRLRFGLHQRSAWHPCWGRHNEFGCNPKNRSANCFNWRRWNIRWGLPFWHNSRAAHLKARANASRYAVTCFLSGRRTSFM
jgi:hypothetical protein